MEMMQPSVNEAFLTMWRQFSGKTTVVLACRRLVWVEKVVLPACRRGVRVKRPSFGAAAAACGW